MFKSDLFSGDCEQDSSSIKVVVSRGSPFASLMIIGEAPGSQENKKGEPFVGRSGKLLDDLLFDVGIDPLNEIYFSNVIKCQPPNNRKPSKEECKIQLPWLTQQIKLVDPLVIILAGTTAMEAILGIKGGITKLRGCWYELDGRLIMPIFHPSYLLRNQSKSQGAPIDLTKSDLLKVHNKLKELCTPLNFIK